MLADHPDFANERVIVISAPNGARRIRSDHPALPVTSAELAECAVLLADNGVSVVHLHVRDESGRHTLDADRYRAAMAGIDSTAGDRLIVQVTTESVGQYTAAEQMALVRELRPEAVSLALRELCATGQDETEAAAFFSWLKQERIWPQYILYTPDEVVRFNELRLRGVFADEHPFCLFVLGRYSDNSTGTPAELDSMLAAADCEAFPWAVCCFGRHEHDAAVKAAVSGGHVRIGFENNLQLSDGTIAADNSELIAQFSRSLRNTSRKAASAEEIRHRLVWG